MEERRRSRRIDLEGKLEIKRLDSQEVNQVSVQITDVSKGGMGFSCQEQLVIGAVYEIYLTIWTKEVIHTCIEIIHVEKKGEQYAYGANFIALSDIDAARIEVYDTIDRYRGQMN